MYSEMTFRHRQSGAALIVALIFLLVMTLLGTQSMRTSTMQERMAGNMRDWNLGFQAAEAALRDAESFLVDTVVLPEFNDIDGFYQVNSPHRPAWTGDADAPGNGFVTSDRGGAHVAEAPKYFVEMLSSIKPAGTSTEIGPMEDIFYFRVTAVGYGGAVDEGGDPLTSVVLSTVYRSR